MSDSSTSSGFDADAIVVGSGFGGAVAAARLAQAGYSVIVLERGRRWEPGDFPRAPCLNGRWFWGRDQGLYDVRWLRGMLVVQAAGWGGGSLAYANVFARPFDAALSETWPAHLHRSELDPYYDLAAHMLDVAPVGNDPRSGRPPDRTTMVEQLMRQGTRPDGTIRPNLAVTFGDPDVWRPNRHGVLRRGRNFVGECVIGCNHGAKNSLDATYLAVAENNGARAITDAEVTRISTHNGGYAVTSRSPSDTALEQRVWRAPRLVLAAGTVGTTELLLRARDVDATLPRLSPQLGKGFSGNGDFLTLAELREPTGDMTTGPTITTNTVLDVPEGRGSVWYQVQDGAFPLVLHELFDAVVPGKRIRTWWRRWFPGIDAQRMFTVLAMGYDSGEGTLRLNRSGRLVLSWHNRWQSHLYRSQRRVGPLLARRLNARLYNPITWSVLRRTTTVHPLGGVRPDPDPTIGVVDDIGEVHGHPGLFVIDGSTLPAATGVNPSATILAVAERSIEMIIRRDGQPRWRAPEWSTMTSRPAPEDSASAFSAELRAATHGGGITFRERMASSPNHQPCVTLRLTAEHPSIDRFLSDPAHSLPVHGTLDIADVAQAAPVSGTLSLFPTLAHEAMRYELHFPDDTGRSWVLTGTKTIRGRSPWRLTQDLTRLRAIAHPVDDPADSTRITLRINAWELVKLLGSIRGIGFTRARRARTAARFATFFARSALN